ncbi:MAG: sulfate adenylyltransferase, partial [Candidatus Hinthialibacter sp.]
MINPHGSDRLNPLFVQDEVQRKELIQEGEGLPSLIVSSAAAANAVMLGGGYFNPLKGFMNKEDSLSVADAMYTTDGLFWPVPI